MADSTRICGTSGGEDGVREPTVGSMMQMVRSESCETHPGCGRGWREAMGYLTGVEVR
jgi:hypothetical protein